MMLVWHATILSLIATNPFFRVISFGWSRRLWPFSYQKKKQNKPNNSNSFFSLWLRSPVIWVYTLVDNSQQPNIYFQFSDCFHSDGNDNMRSAIYYLFWPKALWRGKLLKNINAANEKEEELKVQSGIVIEFNISNRSFERINIYIVAKNGK